MLFSSISFLYYFLPIVLIMYFIVPRKFKNLTLFLASVLFYFYGEPLYVFLMIGTILVTFISAILIEKYDKYKKICLSVSLIISIGLLFLFKYSDFLIKNINFAFNTKIALLNLALPIGISFYTFQLISYIIDVYKGKVRAQKSFLKLATYVSLFPQLIAGPIVRYETIEKELEDRSTSLDDFSYGAMRFTIGLAKKVLIANMLGKLCTIFMGIDAKSIVFYWIYGLSYSMQIYFDFSAYSDMAIGLGRIFGFHFLENFDYPFISKSITEFWRRWHISLGSWFRDYIYIPLGGNRKGNLILFRNIFVVWALTGFWHGANWTFVIWGLYFACILVLEKFFLKNILEKLPNFIQRVYVLFLVMISFIIFGSENIMQAFEVIKGLFGVTNIPFINIETLYYLKSYAVILIVSIMCSTPIVKNILKKMKYLNPIIMICVFILVTAYLVDNSYNPFLYFRF